MIQSATAFVAQLAAHVGRAVAGVDGARAYGLDARLFLGPAEMREHHADGEEARDGVREILADERRRGAVHRLEERDALRIRVVDVRARGHAEAALQTRAEVGDDVAEQVVRDDHSKGRGSCTR